MWQWHKTGACLRIGLRCTAWGLYGDEKACEINNRLHAIKLPRQIALHPFGPNRAPAHLDGQELLMKTDALRHGQPFRLSDDLISQAELR
jgi:hypothetical protein